MAEGLEVGDTVFVPISQFEKDIGSASAFHRTRVLALRDRSAEVDVGGGDTEWVATSKCQRQIGILILAVGDFDSEATLIDPLSKSILQFCRLLFSDDYVRFLKLRSLKELNQAWTKNREAYSHIVFIGHGDGNGLKFAVGGWKSAWDLQKIFDVEDVSRKCFVNLSCELGRASYGKVFSEFAECDSFIAPFHTIHGAIASQFVQSFLIYNFLHGESIKVAFRHAREGVAGAASFRMWRYGAMITDS